MPELLQHLPPHRLLQCLPRLHEPGQRRIHRRPRKPRRVAQQRPVAAVHQHDHRRVRAREMLRRAHRALHHVPGALHLAHIAAHAAELVPLAPVQQPARMRQHRGLRPRHPPPDRAQVDERAQFLRQQRRRVLRAGDIQREHRPVVQNPQERPRPLGLHPQAVRHLAGNIHRLRSALAAAAHQVPGPPDRHEQASPDQPASRRSSPGSSRRAAMRSKGEDE